MCQGNPANKNAHVQTKTFSPSPRSWAMAGCHKQPSKSKATHLPGMAAQTNHVHSKTKHLGLHLDSLNLGRAARVARRRWDQHAHPESQNLDNVAPPYSCKSSSRCDLAHRLSKLLSMLATPQAPACKCSIPASMRPFQPCSAKFHVSSLAQEALVFHGRRLRIGPARDQ